MVQALVGNFSGAKCMRQREGSHASRQSPFFADSHMARDPMPFVVKVKDDLGIRARYREVAEMGGTHTLRDAKGAYALNSSRESETLTLDNTVLWQKNAEAFETWRGPTRKTRRRLNLCAISARPKREGYRVPAVPRTVLGRQ